MQGCPFPLERGCHPLQLPLDPPDSKKKSGYRYPPGGGAWAPKAPSSLRLNWGPGNLRKFRDLYLFLSKKLIFYRIKWPKTTGENIILGVGRFSGRTPTPHLKMFLEGLTLGPLKVWLHLTAILGTPLSRYKKYGGRDPTTPPPPRR